MGSRNHGYKAFDQERRYGHGSSQSKRDPFEVDKGRIIHSGAFRRLQGKTQVFGAGERDFYRTRLTHSLEVAQLGRGMCNELKGDFHPNRDLVESICLAHDIGHPPFGHSGELALHRKTLRYGGFGANPQNLRIVTFLEAKYEPGGLDLTRATLDGLVKYPNVFDKKDPPTKPKFTYSEDAELLKWIKQGVKDPLRKPIEGAIADWADQIAYCVNDVEDTLRAGLLNFVEMRTRAKEISFEAKKVIASRNGRDVPSLTDVAAIRRRALELQKQLMEPVDLRTRKINLKKWTSETIKDLMQPCTIRLTHPHEPCIRYRYTLRKSNKAEALADLLKATMKVLVFEDPRVSTLEHKGCVILLRLFRAFRRDVRLLPLDFQQLLRRPDVQAERLIADFVSGMTDTYAYDYYKRLFEPDSGSFYEHV
jgi:dGTPase